MPNRHFIAASPDFVELKTSPIQPDWIVSGEPHARATEIARSADGASNTMIWDCTAGTFRWFFGVDETVHIIEGEVFVRNDAGQARLLRAGDVAFFPANTWMTWRVDNYVRKVAFLRHPLPQPFGGLLRLYSFAMNTVRLKMRKLAGNPAEN
jgi:uncharacterized cupin superfamily protein